MLILVSYSELDYSIVMASFFFFLIFCIFSWQLSNPNLFLQMPHLATTYAAVNALISVGGEGAFSSVNR